MTWPRQIYVATASLGVYYTADFSDPGTQPVWTAVNTGLAALDCKEFWLDPFDPEGRQYVLLSASSTLYRRESGGAWASILTLAQIGVLTGLTADIFGGFCVDPTVDGRVWVLARCYDGSASKQRGRALYSDDYGDTWTNVTTLYSSNFGYLRSIGSIRASGNNVYASLNTGAGSSTRVNYSTDLGASWGNVVLEIPGGSYPFGFDALQPNRVYAQYDVTGNRDLTRVTNAGGSTVLQDGLAPQRYDAMWFDPNDGNHQRVLRNNTVYATVDEWTNVANGGAVSPAPYAFAPYAGADTDQMLVGLTLGTHVIGALYGEADTTATGIAGANAGTAPFADSIPNTCGGLAQMGIQVVPRSAHVYTGDVTFEQAVAAFVHTGVVAFEDAPATGGVYTGAVVLEG